MSSHRLRSGRFRWLLPLLSLLLVASPRSFAQTPTDATILLNQKRMEIGQLITRVSQETGRTILFDEQVKGLVSLVSKRPVTPDEAWELLDAALHLIGFALVPSTAGQWRIARVAEVVGESPFTRRVRDGSERYVTALIPLEVAPLPSVMNVIQPLAGSSVTLVALESSHSLIASGPEHAIARLTAIADELDRVEERGLRQRVLRYRDVGDVEGMIEAQFEAGRFSERELELWSDARTNSLIYRGSDDAVDRLIAFLDDIDRPIEGEGEIRVLRVLNRDAGEVAEILGVQAPSRRGSKSSSDGTSKVDRTRDAGESGSTPQDSTSSREGTSTGGPGPSAAQDETGTSEPPSFAAGAGVDLATLLAGEEYSIAVDAPTRSLVVRASERGHRIIRELVEKLDERPQLIAVDITVSEIRTPSSLALALSYHVPLLPGDSVDELVGRLISLPAGGGFRTTPIADGALFGRVSRDAGIDFEVPGGGGVLIPIEDTGEIDASKITARTEILIQPSLVVVAGEEHEVFVGSNVPIPTSNAGIVDGVSTQGGVSTFGVSVNFNRQDVGIRLVIDARAGKEGPIELDLEAEITALAPSAAGPVEQVGPTLVKEVLTAKAKLEDGETAILGVDQERRDNLAEGGAPWLKDIPFLGWLFKARGEQVQDTRLVIAARARRLSTPAELVADSIRRRLAFDRRLARERNLPDPGDAPFGVRVTTRSREDDANAIAADLERKGHRTRIHRWIGQDREPLFDVYVLGLDSMADAGELAQRLGEDGWDADLVVFSSRS
ncbi:MAG: hypothetical protein R3F35_22915 [Myxococcota bacterium]